MGIANARQPGLVERLRGRPAIVERDRGWCCCRPGTRVWRKRAATLPRQLGRTLAAGMSELNAERRRTRAPAEIDDARQRCLVCIGIETETAVTDAARRFDGRLLDDDKPGTRYKSPSVGNASRSPHRPGGVLAHRRHRYPIGEGDAGQARGSDRRRVLSMRRASYTALALAASNPVYQSRTTGQLSSRTQSPKLR
jgi:hypothetical protein